MSHETRSRIRMLLAVPSAAVLMLSATQLLASPAPEARLPNCGGYCDRYEGICLTNPSFGYCQYCGCGEIAP